MARETETENVFNLGRRIQREMFGVSSWRGNLLCSGEAFWFCGRVESIYLF